MIYVFFGIALILAAVFVVLWSITKTKTKSDAENLKRSQNELKLIQKREIDLINQNSNLINQNRALQEKNDETIAQLNSINFNESRNLHLNEINNAIEVKGLELNKLIELQEQQTTSLQNLAAQFEDLAKRRDAAQEDLEALASNLAALKEEVALASNQLNSTNQELERAKEDNRLILLAQKDEFEKWTCNLTEKEKHIIEILRELRNCYGELDRDLAKIEWEKIWRSKMQDIIRKNGLDGKCGIYRLVLKEDENVCYVGQAKDIKDRWFTHCKKMVGMESKGGERVYEYGIDDFWWTVIEECNDKELNEREKYWIEYYCCKELGLNKKS